MKSLVGKFGTLALLAAVGGFAVQGCSSEVVGKGHTSGETAESDAGRVTLNLVPVAGITVNSVNYVVTGTPAIAGTPLPSGVLPTPGNDSNFTFGIPVPVGTGYTLSLTAVSAETGDDITCTGSHGPFDVTPNAATAFPITLTCVDNSNGSIIATVDVKTDSCPRLVPTYATAIPGKTDVGKSINLNALGADLDGKTVTYAWSIPAASAGVGNFTNATSAAAKFNCLAQGDVNVTVTMKNGECTKDLQTSVSCKSLLCGNGALDAGESCDPSIPADQPGGSPTGTTFGCPSDCSVSCGDGVIEAPTEECELVGGQPTATCTAQCRSRVAACGDGFVNGSEVCDPSAPLPPGAPANSACKSDCSGYNTFSCGDGIVTASIGEECEPNTTANCSDDCQFIADTACTDCETGSACAPFALNCTTSAGITGPADTKLCYDAQECIIDTGCADGTNTLTSCFCGSLTTSQCGAAPETGPGSPNGPCAGPIKAGMGAGATNTNVLARITNRNFPAGAGIARLNCLKNNPVCNPLCGF